MTEFHSVRGQSFKSVGVCCGKGLIVRSLSQTVSKDSEDVGWREKVNLADEFHLRGRWDTRPTVD